MPLLEHPIFVIALTRNTKASLLNSELAFALSKELPNTHPERGCTGVCLNTQSRLRSTLSVPFTGGLMPFPSSRTPREGNVERQNVTDIARRQMTIVVMPNASLPRLIEWFFLIQYECGHMYSDFGYSLHVCAYGYVVNVEGTHVRCPDCALRHIRKKHCRCNACGYPILPGSDVTVTPISRRWESAVGPRTATLWTPFGLSVINCTRPECLRIGATGFWNGDAYRPYETQPSFQTEIGRAPLIRPDEWREDSIRPKS